VSTASVVDSGSTATDTGSWLVLFAAALALGNGLLLVLSPAQFASSNVLLAPVLTAYGVILSVLGFVFVVHTLTERRPDPRLTLLVALSLVPLWVGSVRVGNVSNAIALGVQIPGAALAGIGFMRRYRIRRPTLSAIALTQILQAVAMIVVPERFASKALYGDLGALLWLLAPSFAIAGIGLRLARRRVWLVAFGALAAGNAAALAITFTGTRTWTGALDFAAMCFLTLLVLSDAPTRIHVARLIFGGAAAIGFSDFARWIVVALAQLGPPPDGAMARPVTAACLGLIGALGLSGTLVGTTPRSRAVGGVATIAAVFALAAAELQDLVPNAAVIGDGVSATDPRTGVTSLLLVCMSAIAVGGPLIWSRGWPKVVAIAVAIAVCALAGANLFAYFIDEQSLFSAFGFAGLRLHTALALLLLSYGVLVVSVPPVVGASLAGRLAVGFGAILALVLLEVFVSIGSLRNLVALLEQDPAHAGVEAQQASGALLGLLVVIGLAMLAIAYAVTRSITQPFRRLSDAMRAFAGGDRGARIDSPGADEIGRVGATFNAMAGELQNVYQDLEERALHDQLTGLPNRRLLTDRLEQAVRQMTRDRGSLAVMVLDLDGFKQVNDTLGHAAGDDVLVAVSGRLVGTVRSADTVARIGGDEFALVLPGADALVANTIADRIRARIGEPIPTTGQQVKVAASIGIATGPNDGAGGDALLGTADRRMYAMKRGAA
jgi:diguanylate cyclase (GGDEF)-like protein